MPEGSTGFAPIFECGDSRLVSSKIWIKAKPHTPPSETTSMLCPHCLTETWFNNKSGDVKRVMIGTEPLTFWGCPACNKVIIFLDRLVMRSKDSDATQEAWQKGVVYPKAPAMKPVPYEVPGDYVGDFNEARLVLELSPKSSAALSRRLLQRILHERFSIKKHDLQQEIKEFISTLTPPAHLAQQLDAVRLVGNFAAHPIKDTNTGAITDVEEGEAELLLETLENLLDFAFVQPAKWSASKNAINAKLSAAGKLLIP
jgi:hypothetical protein